MKTNQDTTSDHIRKANMCFRAFSRSALHSDNDRLLDIAHSEIKKAKEKNTNVSQQ